MNTDHPRLSGATVAEIRAEMARLGVTRADLAFAAGVPYHWISERLGGRVSVSLDDLAKMAAALDADPAALVARAVSTLDPADVA